MSLFKRPHLCACEGYVDIAIEFEPLRQLKQFTEFEELLRNELQQTYGATPSEFQNGITYSTKESPKCFAKYFSERQLETLHKYDVAVEKAKQLNSKYELAIEEHDKFMEEAKNRKQTQRRLREEEKAKKRLKAMHREVINAEYEVVVLSEKLKNFFAIERIRVPLG